MDKQTILYPTSRDLRTILTDAVKRSDLSAFLRRKGIFFFNATTDDLCAKVSEMLLSYDDLQALRSMAYRTVNKQILSGFTLISSAEFDLTSIYNDIRLKGEVKKEGYTLECITEKDIPSVGKVYEGSIKYLKTSAGRVAFIRHEERDVSFIMKRINDNSWQVEVDGGSSNDGKAVNMMLDSLIKGKDIKLDSLLLDYLSRADTIVFFDKLAKEGLGTDWTIEDVERITLKHHAGTFDDKDEEAVGDDEEEVATEQLTGIAQAILEGKNLRENKFVRQAENSGYAFTSMTYVYGKRDKQIKLRAEFKRNPKIFEVCLEGYYEPSETEAGKYEDTMSSLADVENISLRSTFWNNAKKVFREIQVARMMPVRKDSEDSPTTGGDGKEKSVEMQDVASVVAKEGKSKRPKKKGKEL